MVIKARTVAARCNMDALWVLQDIVGDSPHHNKNLHHIQMSAAMSVVAFDPLPLPVSSAAFWYEILLASKSRSCFTTTHECDMWGCVTNMIRAHPNFNGKAYKQLKTSMAPKTMRRGCKKQDARKANNMQNDAEMAVKMRGAWSNRARRARNPLACGSKVPPHRC